MNIAAKSETTPNSLPHILLIVGSLRKQSLNRQMAEWVAAQLTGPQSKSSGEAGATDGAKEQAAAGGAVATGVCPLGQAEVSILDWHDVPVFNQDEEFPAPSAVARVRQEVAAADAVWFFAPEYNHGVPGPLKNLIDWLSRPLKDGSQAVLMGKTATVSTVAGSSCGRYCHSALQPTLDFLKIEVPPVEFTGISFDRPMFTTSVLSLSDAVKTSLVNQANALLAKIS